MSSDDFMDSCAPQVSESDYKRLGAITICPEKETACACYVQERWTVFETNLRNTSVHIRALKLKQDPSRYLRSTSDIIGGLETHVQDAFSHNPLGMEEHLDTIRWHFLDSLLVGREFSFDALAVYKLKLLLIEKRAAATREKGEITLEQFLNEKLTSDKLPEFING